MNLRYVLVSDLDVLINTSGYGKGLCPACVSKGKGRAVLLEEKKEKELLK